MSKHRGSGDGYGKGYGGMNMTEGFKGFMGGLRQDDRMKSSELYEDNGGFNSSNSNNNGNANKKKKVDNTEIRDI